MKTARADISRYLLATIIIDLYIIFIDNIVIYATGPLAKSGNGKTICRLY